VRVQASVEPEARSVVHASPSSQLRGQVPERPAVMARSHVSPASTMPLPQTMGQSSSFAAAHPGGQQWSPFAQATMGCATHAALHAPEVPWTT
jgi:hypothetical protein